MFGTAFLCLGIICGGVLPQATSQFLPAGFILPFPFGCDLNQLNTGVEVIVKELPSLFIHPETLSFGAVCDALDPIFEGTAGCLESLQGLSNLFQTNIDIKAAVDFIISIQLFCGNGPSEAQGLLCDISVLVSCSLQAVDLIKTAALDEFEMLCTTIRDANTGLLQCVENATKRCPRSVRGRLRGAVRAQVDFLASITQYCFPGCEPIVKFLIDGYPRWSHDLDFTIKDGESYCTPIQRTLDVAWGLVGECTAVPDDIRTFFVRDILSFANLTGCNIKLNGKELQMSEKRILTCIQASTVCARRVASIVGVTTDLGPSGGYNIAHVANRTGDMVNRIMSGQATQICKVVKTTLWDQAMGCLDLVTDKCDAELSPRNEMIVMQNTTHALSQACSPGCTDIQRRIEQIERCSSSVEVAVSRLPTELLTGFITPNGGDIEACQWIRSWAACLFDAIHNCPFLDEQYRRLVAPTRKVDMVISMCRITIDLRTAQFYIGNESQPLFQLVMGSGQKRVGHTRNHNRNIFRVLK